MEVLEFVPSKCPKFYTSTISGEKKYAKKREKFIKIERATGPVLTSGKEENTLSYYTQFCCEKGQTQDLHS